MKHRTDDRRNTVKHHGRGEEGRQWGAGSERRAEIMLSVKKGTGWECRKENSRTECEERAIARVKEEASAMISKKEGV